MIKKATAVLLCVLLVISLATAAAFAADSEEKTPVIYFDTADAGWSEISQIYCHIFAYNGDAFYEWQTKKEKCSDEGDGIWSYDLAAKGVALEDDKTYCVIFSSDTGAETYQLLMDTSCYEDTVYVTGEHLENPTDSNKHSDTAYWKESDKTVYGPLLAITSIGNVIGTACPPDTTREDMFKDFLLNTLDNARSYSGLSDQRIIDHIIEDLPLTQEQAASVIEECGAAVDWQPSSPATPDQPTVPQTEAPTEPQTEEPTLPPSTGILGDVDCDGVVTILDATLIQKYKAHMIDDSKIDLSVADVDGDGAITVMDATRIQKYKAGLCELEPKPVISGNILSFDASSAGWNDSEIFYRITSADGTQSTAEGSKALKNSDGTYAVEEDAIGFALSEDQQYIITFSNSRGDTTYDLVFDKSCFGDIVQCTSEEILDRKEAVWKDKDKTVCGPLLAIDPVGNVIGDCIPAGQTPYTVLYDFFKDRYTSALSRSGKTSQALVDDIAQQIGICYQYEISVAIAESGTNVNWIPARCPLPLRG